MTSSSSIESIDDFVGVLHGRIRDNDDAVVLITGATGSSKSTLAFHLGRAYEARRGGAFTRANLRRSTEDFMRLLVRRGVGFFGILDESTKGGLAVEHQTRENKAWRKYLMECRKRRQVIVVLATHIDDVDPYCRNKRARYWFLVHRRGYAVLHVQVRRDYPGTKSSWVPVLAVTYGPIEDDDWQEYEKEAIEGAESYGKAALGEFVPQDADVMRLSAVARHLLLSEGIGQAPRR